MKKKYIEFKPNQTKGYPFGKKIYYECLLCGESVESMPEFFSECKCKNITVDMSGGHLSIINHEEFNIFKV